MKKGNVNDWEREEKLFHAIGNLPEDMIAQAAEYKRTKKGIMDFPIWKGLAVAACVVLVLWGGTKISSVVQRQTIYRVGEHTEKMTADPSDGSISQKEIYSGAREGLSEEETKDKKMTGSALDGAMSGRKEISVWAMGAVISGEMTEDSTKSSAQNESSSQKRNKDSAKNNINSARILLEEGKTIALQTKEERGNDAPVITFCFGQAGEDVTYSLHSQASNCRIVTVTHDEQSKYVNSQDAECASGDTVTFDTKQRATAGWEYNIVPDWTDMGIDIIDIINLCEKEGGEEYKIGKIVIGKQKEEEGEGKRYYGVFQSKND